MKAYIPLFLLENDAIVCGPSVHREEACARDAQPIIQPFAVLEVALEQPADDKRVACADWRAAVEAQVNSAICGFLQFQAKPKAERDAAAAKEQQSSADAKERLWRGVDRMLADAYNHSTMGESLDMLAMRDRFFTLLAKFDRDLRLAKP